jgi:hypothetical protein
MTVSIWGGTEHQKTQFAALNPLGRGLTVGWSPAGGASYSWQGQRASFRAEGSRQTSDGGGLNQAVTLQQASADLRYRLARRWTTGVGARYADNDPTYTTPGMVGKIRLVSASAGLDCQITQTLVLGVQYGRDRQEYRDALPAVGAAERNRVLLSLSYSFSHTLGR